MCISDALRSPSSKVATHPTILSVQNLPITPWTSANGLVRNSFCICAPRRFPNLCAPALPWLAGLLLRPTPFFVSPANSSCLPCSPRTGTQLNALITFKPEQLAMLLSRLVQRPLLYCCP
jgi:hypothetical protein